MELKDAMECACAYLSYRDRSRSELKRYLAKKGCQEEQILQVLEKLEEYGYVDDRRLARSVISSQLETKAAGKRAAGQKLQRLGIEREIARQALGEIDPDKERENALMWAEKLWPRLEGDLSARKAKLQRRLVSKGFDYDTIRSALLQVLAEERLKEDEVE